MKHVNPYHINDPHNWLEVSANSSHPELKDAKRIWKFGAYSFTSENEVAKFFESEGLKISQYSTNPTLRKNGFNGKNEIIIEIVEKYKSRNQQALRSLTA